MKKIKNMENKKLNLFLEEVKKEMILNKVYYKKAKFKCFSDNMFTYGYSNHSLFFEFTFICQDTLFDKMTIKDLLELKKIGWFDNRIFDNKTMDLLGGKSYSIFDEEGLTDEEVMRQNISIYNDLTEGMDEIEFPDGVYLSDGCYLQSNGEITGDE